ncbi:hypothetical protein KBD71_03125 [Candidatus Woesebacteria bacterium]|nr:hypothetical protein [Candidatus Woesebacteria bacterium]
MKKAYLIAYSVWSLEQMTSCLNSLSLIEKWRYDMPNAFYVISMANSNQISNAIREKLGTTGRFIVTEISVNNSQGWLTPGSWYLINNKEYLKE